MREPQGRDTPRRPLRAWLLAILLVVAAAVVYAPVRHLGYVSYDDPEYILDDPGILAGLTSAGIRRVLVEPHNANWHPLTSASWMLDLEVFGLDPGAQHLVNAGLHAINVLLLFALLLRGTGSPGPSALAAGLFALHPLHVESVAWVSQRKDVLSTCFGFAALFTWLGYVRRPRGSSYLGALGLFALGLASKPMLVTWPLVMVLLDVWPLGRFQGAEWRTGLRRSLREKLPFFAASALACAVTVWAHAAAGAMERSQPALHHLVNALLSYAAYLRQMAWPVDLAVLHPYPTYFPLAVVAASAGLIGGVTFGCLRLRRHPYLLVGWLWYLVTLVPVIGLVPVGSHAHADRYAYLPLVGIYVALSFGLAAALRGRSAALRGVAVTGTIAVLAMLGLATTRQVATWTDSVTLYRHALDVHRANPIVWNNLGAALSEQGRTDEALEAYRRATESPSLVAPLAHQGVASALLRAGRPREAAQHLDLVLAAVPASAEALYQRGRARKELGDLEAARRDLEQALAARPGQPEIHEELGRVLNRLGRAQEASVRLETARQLRRPWVDRRLVLVDALGRAGRADAAIAELESLLRMDPQHAEVRRRLEAARIGARAPRGQNGG